MPPALWLKEWWYTNASWQWSHMEIYEARHEVMQLNIQHHFGVNVIVYYPIEILNLYIIKWIWKRSLLTHMARIPCKVQLHLTHWGRMTHICVGELAIIGSDNGLSPGRRQAIIWTNAGILSIGPLGTNFSEILIEMQTFSFKKTHLKMSSGKSRLFCLGLNVLMDY